MAEIVGVYAASHTPVMLNFPHAAPDEDREAIFASFRELGRRMADARPEVVIVLSDDHLHNFFLDCLPAFCIGGAATYETPVEHWLKAEKRTLRGDASLGGYLIAEALESGFDPALSMNLTLDHGTLTPLELMGAARDLPIVPLLVNCVQPPLPTMKRALQWGRFLGDALRRYDGLERVAVLGTGGLSHDVGTPRMGLVNESFDRELLRLLAEGDDEAIVRYAAENVGHAGNGGEEIRMWLMAHGAANGARFDLLIYKAVSTWYTGIGIAEWRAA